MIPIGEFSEQVLSRFDARHRHIALLAAQQGDAMQHQHYADSKTIMTTTGPFGDQSAENSLEMNMGSTSLVPYTVQTPSEAGFDCAESTLQHLPFPGSSTADSRDDSAQQYAKLQAKLAQSLGPEYISYRQGGGGAKVAYLEGSKVIDLANEIFGFSGWSTDVVSLETQFVDVSSDGKRFSVGVSSMIKVTLRDGAYHTDTGWGEALNLPAKGAAIQKARKEAVTDGTKRALRKFGRAVGNCLYDQKHLSRLSNVKPQVPKFDPSKLKRGPDERTDSDAVVRGEAQSADQGASKAVAAVSHNDSVHKSAPTSAIPHPVSPCLSGPANPIKQQQQQQHCEISNPVTPQSEADRARKERLRLAQARKAELARRSVTDGGQTRGKEAPVSPSKDRPASIGIAGLPLSDLSTHTTASTSASKTRPLSDFEDGFDMVEFSMSQLNSLEARELSRASTVSAGDRDGKGSSGEVKPVLRLAAQASPSAQIPPDMHSDVNKRAGDPPVRESSPQHGPKKSRYGI